MVAKTKRVKRYNLVLPEDLFDELQAVADQEQTTVVDVIRKFIKLGLLVVQADKSPDSKIIIREGETERELIFV